MTYYQLLRNAISNEDQFHWDYYQCHSDRKISSIFDNPNDFIGWTFMYAKKDRLTSSVVYNEYQLDVHQFSDARAAHSVSSFFLGFVLANGLIGENLSSFCSFEELCATYPFSYVWTLTSLYHDYGYRFETDHGLFDTLQRNVDKEKSMRHIWYDSPMMVLKETLKMDFSIWKPRYLNWFVDQRHTKSTENNLNYYKKNSQIGFESEMETVERFVHDNISNFRCNNSYVHIPARSGNTINKYLTYRLFGNPNYACLDHGIAGGMFFYDRIIKSFIYEYQQKKAVFPETKIDEFTIDNILGHELRIGLDQAVLFLYIADCIINHNIWKATESNKDIYDNCGLKSLIGGNYEKVNFHKNPLLFILCLSDTLEPFKNFSKTVYGNSIDDMPYKKEIVFDIFKNYKIDVGKSAIKVTVPDQWCERLNQMLSDMTDWMDISFSKSGKSFSISIN